MKAHEPIKYSLGDIIDRMTILTRKIKFGEEAASDELAYLVNNLKLTYGIDGKLVAAIIRVAQANYDIWNLENEIRKGGEGNLGLEEIGRRALEIRDLNKKRIKYKNEISTVTGKGFVEYKIQHRSQ